jgi:hypothetical protein
MQHAAVPHHLEQHGQVQVQQQGHLQQQHQSAQQPHTSSQQSKAEQLGVLDTGQSTLQQRMDAQQALEDYSYIK